MYTNFKIVFPRVGLSFMKGFVWLVKDWFDLIYIVCVGGADGQTDNHHMIRISRVSDNSRVSYCGQGIYPIWVLLLL